MQIQIEYKQIKLDHVYMLHWKYFNILSFHEVPDAVTVFAQTSKRKACCWQCADFLSIPQQLAWLARGAERLN